MPLGSGYFIDLKSGKYFPIREHANAVAENPKKFRIKPEEIKGLSPFSHDDRIKILTLAMERGFVRVRAHGGEVVFEFKHPNREDAIYEIVKFMDEVGFGDFTRVRINDIHRRANYDMQYKDMKDPASLEAALGFSVLDHKELNRLLKKLVEQVQGG